MMNISHVCKERSKYFISSLNLFFYTYHAQINGVFKKKEGLALGTTCKKSIRKPMSKLGLHTTHTFFPISLKFERI